MNTAFLVVSGLILIAGVIWLWGARYLARDTELAAKRLDDDEGGGGSPPTSAGAGSGRLRRFVDRMVGTNGLSIRQLLTRTINHVLTQHEILTRASAIAFAAMMAFVPLIALVMTIGAYLLPDLTHPAATGIGNISVDQVEAALRALFPGQTYKIVEEQIVRIQSQPPLALLSLTVLLALWTASGLFLEVIDALNRIYGVAESRTWWRLRARALVMTVVQCAILFASLIAIAFWPQIVRVLGLDSSGATVAAVVKWLAIFVMLLLSFALIFHMGPNAAQRRKWVTPGALFGTLVFLAATYIFRIYVQKFAQYELLYGSLGGVMMLLIWFWITSLVLLAAAEMNRLAEIASAARSPTGHKHEDDPGKSGGPDDRRAG
jgi:membrane protein